MAIFFHDLIYDATRHDNEEESAKAFREFVRDAPSTSPLRSLEQPVVEMILQTKHHMQCPSGAPMDLKYFLDMDLAILGASKDRYEEYMRDIRIEYGHVPHDLYTKGRSQVLKTFLMAKQLYFTAEFRTALDAAARRNLAYELGVLSTPEVSTRRLTIADLPEMMQFVKTHWVLRSDGAAAALGSSPTTAESPTGGKLESSVKGATVGKGAGTAPGRTALRNAGSPTKSAAAVGGPAAATVATVVPDPLALSEEALLHCVTSNMDLCLSYRCAHTNELIGLVLCTRVLRSTALPPPDDVGRVAREEELRLRPSLLPEAATAKQPPFAVPTGALEASRLDHHIVGNHIVLHGVVVHSNRRRRGLGSALIRNVMAVVRAEAGEAAASGRARPPFSALCWVDSPMHGLLKKLGFHVVDDVTTTAVVMTQPAAATAIAEETGREDVDREKGVGGTGDDRNTAQEGLLLEEERNTHPSSPTSTTAGSNVEFHKKRQSVAVVALNTLALQKQMPVALPSQILEMSISDW